MQTLITLFCKLFYRHFLFETKIIFFKIKSVHILFHSKLLCIQIFLKSTFPHFLLSLNGLHSILDILLNNLLVYALIYQKPFSSTVDTQIERGILCSTLFRRCLNAVHVLCSIEADKYFTCSEFCSPVTIFEKEIQTVQKLHVFEHSNVDLMHVKPRFWKANMIKIMTF